jgi:hypothetical protein
MRDGDFSEGRERVQLDQPAVIRPLARFGGVRPLAPVWFATALADAPERSSVDVDGAAIETLCWGRRGTPSLILLHGTYAHADWWSFIASATISPPKLWPSTTGGSALAKAPPASATAITSRA